MALVKWIPFKDLLFLQDRLSRIFDEALARYGGLEDISMCTWTPPTDIYETRDSIVLKVEIPGIDIKDVTVEIKENILTLKGERVFTKCSESENYHRMECSYGAFQRACTLPAAVDKDKVKAVLKDGILEITVPKVKPKKSKQIKVKVE